MSPFLQEVKTLLFGAKKMALVTVLLIEQPSLVFPSLPGLCEEIVVDTFHSH